MMIDGGVLKNVPPAGPILARQNYYFATKAFENSTYEYSYLYTRIGYTEPYKIAQL